MNRRARRTVAHKHSHFVSGGMNFGARSKGFDSWY
jgi:hypothetical protein